MTNKIHSNSSPIGFSHKDEIKKGFHNLLQKIQAVAIRIIDQIGKILSPITRYFGPKTWSGCHMSMTKELSPDETRPYLKPLAAMTSSFANDDKWIQGLGLSLHNFQEDSVSIDPSLGNFTTQGHSLFDPNTGLKLVVSKSDKEVFIAFGAKHSTSVELNDAASQNAMLNIQNSKIVKNFLGAKVDIYEQAAAVVAALINSPQFQGKNIQLTGQCYGGSLATYAGLKNQLPVVSFNSFPLGAGQQQQLGKEVLKKADQFVTHISAKSDYVSDQPVINILDRILTFVGIKTPGNFGKRYVIPSAYSTNDATHSYILGSVMKHLGYDVRTLPSQVINVENLITNIDDMMEEYEFDDYDFVKSTLIHIIKQPYIFEPSTPSNLYAYYDINNLTDHDVTHLYHLTAKIRNEQKNQKSPFPEKVSGNLLAIREHILYRVDEEGASKAEEFKQLFAESNIEKSETGAIDQLFQEMDNLIGEYPRFYKLIADSDEKALETIKEAKLAATEDNRKALNAEKSRVLHASLEYNKGIVGGLGSVTQSLLPKQNEYGNDSRIVTPFFDFYHSHFPDPKFIGFVTHEYKGEMVKSAIYKVRNGTVAGKKDVVHYLVKPCPKPILGALFDVGASKDLYKNYDHSGGSDRLLYFSSAVANLAGCYKGKKHAKTFDVLHLHGWHVGVSSLLTQTYYNPMREEVGLPEIRTVFNVHLAAEQGIHNKTAYEDVGLPTVPYQPFVNIHADAVSTADRVVHVSKTAAADSMTSKYGYGLNAVSKKRHDDGALIGITNGINHKNYDPTNAALFKDFAITDLDESLAAKERAKKYLYEQGVITDPNKPLFMFVGRYSSEKGIDMLPAMVDEIAKQGGQTVIMGLKTQDSRMLKILNNLDIKAQDPKNNFRLYTELSDQTQMVGESGVSAGNLIRLATDMVLVPSHQEACGLVPMESISMGALVVTSNVFGLRDTCKGLDDEGELFTLENFNAFTYNNHSIRKGKNSLEAIKKAFHYLRTRDDSDRQSDVKRLIESAVDYDWLSKDGAAEQYQKVYTE